MENYLNEAFQALNMLNEESFNLSAQEDVEKLSKFLDNDNEDEVSLDIIDRDAETKDELKDNYIGKVILDCCVCHSLNYQDADKIVVDEETELANVGDECPYCYSTDGYKIVGEVAPYKVEDEAEVEIEDKEIEDEEIDESFKSSNRRLKNESVASGVLGAAVGSLVGHPIAGAAIGAAAPSVVGEVKDILTDNLEEKEYEIFHNSNGTDYKIIERSKSGENALLTDGKEWIVAWNCPKNNKGSWGQGHYFFDEESAREVWNDKYVNESYRPTLKRNRRLKEDFTYNYEDVYEIGKNLVTASKETQNSYGPIDYEDLADAIRSLCNRENKRIAKDVDVNQVAIDILSGQDGVDESFKSRRSRRTLGESNEIGKDLSEYQKWVDYDMEKYGKISGKTMSKIKSAGLSVVKDQYGDYEVIADRPIDEDFNRVEIETDKETMEMTADENGKVSVTTEPKEETIRPVSSEVKDEIEVNTEEAKLEDEEEVDKDFDEFDEETFDKLGESYLKNNYNNVSSFKTSAVRMSPDKLVVEGKINFKSGKSKNTSFIFEGKDITKRGKMKLIGENAQITKGRKAFTLTGRVSGNKFITESLNYNYSTRDNNGKHIRLYGTERIK